MRFNVRHGVTVSAAMTGAATLRGILNPLTGARFVRQSVVYAFVEPNAVAPQPDSDASRVAVFVFACTDSQYAIIEIPGIREEFIDIDNPCGGLWISATNPVVVAFVEYMISGVFVNRFGYELTALLAAFVQIRP